MEPSDRRGVSGDRKRPACAKSNNPKKKAPGVRNRMAYRALDGLLRRMACPSPQPSPTRRLTPAFPQAGVFFHRAVCVDASPDLDH